MARGWTNSSGPVLTTAAATVFLLSASGCVSGPRITEIIHESAAGSVALEKTPHQGFAASHPLPLDPITLTHILAGVQIQEQHMGVFPSATDKPAAAPAFSKEDIRFLAPLLSTALVTAWPEHQISFRVIHPTSSQPLVTAGTLYCHGPFLYLTLTHFRYHTHDPVILYLTRDRLPYSTALTRKTVRFTPGTVGQATNGQSPGASAHPTLTTLAIDYQRVGALAHGTLAREGRRAGPVMPQTSHKSTNKQEAELQALKREIQALKKQMSEWEERFQKSSQQHMSPGSTKKKTSPKRK